MKKIQGINLKKLGNAATFLSFLTFSFLAFSILNPVGRSDADETQTVDYTIGAYNLSMAANTEVDAHAIAGYEQKVHSALDYISLSNTCPDGLSVMISSNSETNALVGDNGSEIVATEPGGELSDNSWGFSLDNGSIWNAVPENDENPIVVYRATTELADPTNFSILYGFKIDRNAVRDGIYSTDVLYTMAPDAGCFLYKVIWDGAGGEVSEDLPTFIDQDELVDLSALPKPIRDYYDFAGWEIDGVTYTGEETAVDINIHNDPIINATALWTPTNYSISYNLNGGSVSDNPTNYNVESEPLSLNNPTRHGYTFKGWSGPDLIGNENKAVVIPTGSHDNRVYIANWTPIDYALTYELNGGAATNPTSYNIESPLITLNSPTKNYYNFKGWSGTDLTGKENTTVKIQTGSTGARNYEANWEPTEYAITYKLHGGAATNPSSYNVETNTFTLNNPSRGQYDFTGWAGTELSGSANKTVTIRRGSNGNRDYDANWQPTNYTILYTLNGGSATNPTTYNVETGEITLNNPTRANYDFVGWSGTDLTGSNNKTVKIPNAAYGDRSYTAHWTPKNYSISYTMNGGSASNPTSYNVETNSFTLNNPTRANYDFVGWSGTGLTGSNNKTVTITKGSSGNRSYTANFSPTSYSISYTLNGGSATNPTSYTVESNNFTLNNPSRSYYDFSGWGGTGLTGTGNKTVTIAQGSTGARSYTAYWTPTNYSISYTLNGGSVSGNPTSYNIESNAFTLSNPTRANYNFTGWSGTGLSGTGNKTVTVPKGSAGNRSYTANWAPICSFTSKDFGYTGGVQSWTVPTGCGGTYKLEVWGAQGGNQIRQNGEQRTGGYGGYAVGTKTATENTVWYVVVGGAGTTATYGADGKKDGGYNGGGFGFEASYWDSDSDGNYNQYHLGGGGGGGATHIAARSGVLSTLNSYRSSVLIVAGGGGGAGTYMQDSPSDHSANGGAGGGTTGSKGSYVYAPDGGTQTSAANGGGFGYGGSWGGGDTTDAGQGGSGGGGGWFGGGSANGNAAGSGGSGYIGGVTGGSMANGQRAGHGYARITKV